MFSANKYLDEIEGLYKRAPRFHHDYISFNKNLLSKEGKAAVKVSRISNEFCVI